MTVGNRELELYMIIQRGFTIIELMITLLIVAILSTMALPSFTQMIKNNRLTTQANELVLALNLSRSEAVKRGTSVTISAVGGNWANGWTVTDINGQTLRIGDPLEGDLTLTNTSGSITYQASGVPTVLPGSFSLCDDRTGETGRTISISITGRVSVSDLACS